MNSEVIVSYVIAAYMTRVTKRRFVLACGECLEAVCSRFVLLCMVCGNLSWLSVSFFCRSDLAAREWGVALTSYERFLLKISQCTLEENFFSSNRFMKKTPVLW